MARIRAALAIAAALAAAAPIALHDEQGTKAPIAAGRSASPAPAGPAAAGAVSHEAALPLAPMAELDAALAANDCTAVLASMDAVPVAPGGAVQGLSAEHLDGVLGCLWAAHSDDTHERLLRVVLAAEPAHPVATMDLAWMLKNQQRHDEALEVMDRALALRPDTRLLARRAVILMSTLTTAGYVDADMDARWNEAAGNLVRAVEVDPALGPPVYEAVIVIMGDPEHYARGVPLIERVLAAMLAEPHNIGLTPAELASMYMRLSELLVRGGQPGVAVAYADQAMALPLDADDRERLVAHRQALLAPAGEAP